MRIQLLHSYKGAPSGFIRLNAGEHDLAPELAKYLIENGHALAISESLADVSETIGVDFADGEDFTVETVISPKAPTEVSHAKKPKK